MLLIGVLFVVGWMATNTAASSHDPILRDPAGDALANAWADLTALYVREAGSTLEFTTMVAELQRNAADHTTGTAYLVTYEAANVRSYAGFMLTLGEEFHAGLWNTAGYPETSTAAVGTVTYGAPATVTVTVPRPTGDRISNLSLVSLDFKLAAYELAADEDALPPVRSLAYVELDEARSEAEFVFVSPAKASQEFPARMDETSDPDPAPAGSAPSIGFGIGVLACLFMLTRRPRTWGRT